MLDWNVIVTVKGDQFRSACELLTPLGQVRRTAYYNVLAVKVEDVHEFMETLRDWMTTDPDMDEAIARVAPVSESFTFETASEFETKAQECVTRFARQLAGQSFHMRMHRRGGKEKLGRTREEQFLGGVLHEAVEQAGASAEVEFKDPDYIVAIETLDDRAGVALWSRDELRRYPFLRLD